MCSLLDSLAKIFVIFHELREKRWEISAARDAKDIQEEPSNLTATRKAASVAYVPLGPRYPNALSMSSESSRARSVVTVSLLM